MKSLAMPKEVVQLGVDNQVAYFYLLKGGGRLLHLNSLMRDFWAWCLKHHITVKVHWVTSQDDKENRYTRLGLDTGDYTLDHGLFLSTKTADVCRDPPPVGHVCQSRKLQISPVLCSVPTLESKKGGRFDFSTGRRSFLLLQSPMESDY